MQPHATATPSRLYIILCSSSKVQPSKLLVAINPKEMILPSLGFEPESMLAFQDLHTTDVATSSLNKKLGHLVEVNQKGHI